jgi:hypothetical protein
MRIPLALMLSADPVPNQLIALDAPTVPRASGSIRFLHIASAKRDDVWTQAEP